MKEMKNRTQTPLVSVLIPTYNAGNYLRPALESVLQQTYSNLEIIIIDDGSTDNSLSSILDISDKRLRTITQKNSGKAVALNRALEIINGQYWLIQDADDLSFPDRVEKLLRELEANEQLAAVYSGHDLLVENRRLAPTFSDMTIADCQNEIANFRIPAHDASGMYRVAHVERLRFDPELKIGQGIDFIFQVGELHPVCRIKQCLYTYRINFQSTIRKNPTSNMKWINLVRRKACDRRGLNYSQFYLTETTAGGKRANTSLNHIVSHCMNSIVDLKVDGYSWRAVRTGIACLQISPNDLTFYKPLIYSLLPITFIQLYRNRKRKSRVKIDLESR